MNTPLKHILEMMKKRKVHIAAVYNDDDFQGNHYFRKYS